MAQQTIESKVSSDPKSQTVNSTELAGLLGIINDLKSRNKALELKVERLEARLEQRVEKTASLYQERKAHFGDMQDKVYEIFLDFPDVAWSYEELQEEWRKRYPSVNCVNVPRRILELAEQNLLWRVFDSESKKVYHYLRLEEEEEKEEDGVS